MMALLVFIIQFDTAADIPKRYFHQNNVIFGKVVRVIDGDTIRVKHCRTRFSNPSIDKNQKRIYDSTLSIRIYGVDAPELQKRKSDPPSQPFAEEAKELTSNLCLHQKVSLKLLRRDQYGRAVAKVETMRHMKTFPPFRKKDISIELTRKGLATLYTGGGAEYDGNKELLESEQEKARKRGRGIWSDDSYVSPAEFKRQQTVVKHSKASTNSQTANK
jgi:endonuclease YncB( thermonuclease family)